MPVMTIEYGDDAERLALEQAVAYVTELRRIAQAAPRGTVLAACEEVVMNAGRGFLRDSLSRALECRIRSAEQKGGKPAPGAAHAATPPATKAATRGGS